ncbi:MAG: EAL domain-containing protein [Gammaproteobacteria bacterium]|nr:EAL domain-containing protein [Gammaproteobacteria bacterium]
MRIHVDDFGTGYSSLSRLRHFPIDGLKIDRSFVIDIPNSIDNAAITNTIIAMAHTLRKKVIAEGVETEEQLSFLQKNGCEEVQGYLFSRPVSNKDMAKLLSEQIRPKQS